MAECFREDETGSTTSLYLAVLYSFKAPQCWYIVTGRSPYLPLTPL
jgi:hypothetical protein